MIGSSSSSNQMSHEHHQTSKQSIGGGGQPHHQHQHLVNHRTSNANQQHNADDDYQDDHGMRVGNNYQAEIPQFIASAPAPEYYEDEKAIRVWSPYNKIPDHVLDEFINKAKEKFFYNTEQALGMLSWHKFDLNRAYADLPNFVPYPNEWSVEDKVLFEQAYQFHEKQFSKIKAMLPDKTMAHLINYYYSWKKTRTRASLMERQTKRFAARKAADSNGPSDEEELDDENEADETSKTDHGTGEIVTEMEASKDPTNEDVDATNDDNFNCGVCRRPLLRKGKKLGVPIDGIIENICSNCLVKWRVSGKRVNHDLEIGDCFYTPQGQPKRILFKYADVLNIINGPVGNGDETLKLLDKQIQDEKRDIQATKQTLCQINEKILPIAEQVKDLDTNKFSDILPEYKPTQQWSCEETQLVIQGLRRYGTDFSAISDVVRTKSPELIRLWFVAQKDRLGLSVLVDEFEKEKEMSKIPRDKQQKEQSQQPTPTDQQA